MSLASRARHHGFSLPELVLGLLIAAVVAHGALASWQHALQRARRAAATAALLELALLQERRLAVQGRYAGSLAELGWPHANGTDAPWPDAGRACYMLRLRALPSDPTPGSGYEAFAIPVGTQRDEACGTLRIDHLGRHGAQSADCW